MNNQNAKLSNSTASISENSFFHACLVKFLAKAHRHGLSIQGGNINGWFLVGPDAQQWDADLREMAISQGQNYQAMDVDMASVIEESGIEIAK